jgi:phosphohistidine swiveling domain-containing protein
MKYIKGLTKKKLNNWVGKKWYHQRFDGSPYFLHFIAEGEIQTHEKRKLGGNFTVHYCFFDTGRADWYIEMDDIKKVYTSIIKAGRKNPNIGSYFIKLWQPEQDLFYKKCTEVGNVNLSKLNDKELIDLHDEFLQITLNKNSSSSIIDGFALGTDELIAEEIKKVYDNSKLKDEVRFTEVFSVLTAPIHLSFINEAEVEFLKIALKIRKNEKDKDKLLKEHQKKFFWIKNNYVDAYVLDVDYFKKELDKIFSLNISIGGEIKKIRDTPELNKKKKKEFMDLLKIDDDLKLLIEVSEDFTYWQDERKKSTFWTTHYFSLILDEISKRTDIPADELKYMTPREVSKIFENKPTREVLQQRKENGVFYWDKEGHEALYGKDADEIKNKILGSTDLSDVNDFRGLTASMGKATGRVKILKSVKEINKIEKGDILVAVMTRPDYVPAMKKAAAIVTDEGGVTSHAAIVSRELGIPCIIGTKIATKVLKDGMLVEVNANHSWVKIIR